MLIYSTVLEDGDFPVCKLEQFTRGYRMGAPVELAFSCLMTQLWFMVDVTGFLNQVITGGAPSYQGKPLFGYQASVAGLARLAETLVVLAELPGRDALRDAADLVHLCPRRSWKSPWRPEG